ncbi:MAG: hypothetical protein HKN14_15960 [Marinicaulis sp.]|nr:hypothetical protein [Marinicaulis sp.]NNL87588.1 hypothetical protein [Marinicaulis sp.]
MSEPDLLELAAMSRANLGFLVTQIIAVQFAIIAGIYLFLNRTGILLKLFIFVLYTAGYAGLLSLYYWEQDAYVAVREAIQALPEPSAASNAVIDWVQGPGRNVSTYVKGLFIANWFVIAFFLFAPILRDRD